MPNSKDAAKRYRQNLKRRDHNRSIKSRVKTAVRAFESAVQEKNQASAESSYADFVKLIDTAAGKGVFHRNTAARKKSRLHKRLNALA